MIDRSTDESSDTAPTETTNPQVVSTVVVTLEDVVAALEAALGTGREAVLRVTPPFSGRMRARLHVAGADGYDDPEPIHIDPTRLVEPCPDYPTANETAADLEDDEINTDRHEAAHIETVATWREAVRANAVNATEIETSAGAVAVEVLWLGDDSD